MRRQSGYAILLTATILCALLAVLTLWPMSASKANAFGYFSHCSWAPWSTIILLLLAGFFCLLRKWFCKR